MAAEVGFGHRDDDDMVVPSGYITLAPGAHVPFVGLVGLHKPHFYFPVVAIGKIRWSGSTHQPRSAQMSRAIPATTVATTNT